MSKSFFILFISARFLLNIFYIVKIILLTPPDFFGISASRSSFATCTSNKYNSSEARPFIPVGLSGGFLNT